MTGIPTTVWFPKEVIRVASRLGLFENCKKNYYMKYKGDLWSFPRAREKKKKKKKKKKRKKKQTNEFNKQIQ